MFAGCSTSGVYTSCGSYTRAGLQSAAEEAAVQKPTATAETIATLSHFEGASETAREGESRVVGQREVTTD